MTDEIAFKGFGLIVGTLLSAHLLLLMSDYTSWSAELPTSFISMNSLLDEESEIGDNINYWFTVD
jgi:hypothetical protein